MNKLMRMGLWLGMLALLAGLASYAVAGTTYTWTNNNAVWSAAGNWSPAGGPPGSGDTGILTGLTCKADANLTGGPTIEVRTNAVLKWGNGANIALSGHTLVLKGGKFESNCGNKGNVSSADTVALEADSVIHGGISGSDNIKCTITGPIQNGPGGGQGKLTLDTSYLVYGNGDAYLIISSTNNTYSGGTVITSATYAAGYPFAGNSSRPVYVTAPGGLGLGDVLVANNGMLLIQATNTTAAGKVITVSTNAYLMEGTTGTFNSLGHSIRLLNGSCFRSGGWGAWNYLNCYDAISVEGTVYVQKPVETGSMTMYGIISNGASAGKLAIQVSGIPDTRAMVLLANSGNSFSGGIDVQAGAYLCFVSNNVAGSGPVTLLAANSYLQLDQAPDADWTVTNNLAGNGTITVEAGNGANTLTCTGTVNPGTNGTAVTTNSAGILTIAGQMKFGTGGRLWIDIASTNGVAGVDFDQLKVNYGLTNLNNATLYVNVATNLSPTALLGQSLIVATNKASLATQFSSVSFSGDGAGKYWQGTVTYNNPAGTVKLSQLVERNPSAPWVDNANGTTGITANAAWMNGTLQDPGTGQGSASVSVFWGLVDQGTNKTAWANTNTFGSCVAGQLLTTNITGLIQGTNYYYRFYGTNAAGYDAWAFSSSVFPTPNPPAVTTNNGAAPVGKFTATLNGILTQGGSANITICWGQNSSAWANTNTFASTILQGVAFSTNITGLAASTPYYYQCFASNVAGTASSAVASFTTLSPVTYTWQQNNGVWSTSGNWNPAGGPPSGGDTGIVNSALTCIADANLTGGPTIEVRTNALLYCGNGAGATFGGHTIVLNGGRWALNSGSKGVITSSDTVALESDSELRAGINPDDQQWTLSGLIRDGLGGGKGRLTINTSGLAVGNQTRGLVEITGANNTYSGGTVLFSDNYYTYNGVFSRVLVNQVGSLGLGDVLVSAYGYLLINATNTTAAGKVIAVDNLGYLTLGDGGGNATFNSRGHNFCLRTGGRLRSGLVGNVGNVVNSYDALALEGSPVVQNFTQAGAFYLYGAISNGASAGKMTIVAPAVAGYSVYLCNASNTFSGGLDIQAGGCLNVNSNGAYGTGPISLLATNSYLALDQTPDADWTLTNSLAGCGTVTVETGNGARRLTCAGAVNPGTNGTTVTTNSTGILTLAGNMAFALGSRLTIDIAGSNAVAGVDFDRLVVDHTLTNLANATLQVNVSTNLFKYALQGQELIVVSNATAIADTFASVEWNAPWRGKVKYNQPAGTVKLTEVTSAGLPGTVMVLY